MVAFSYYANGSGWIAINDERHELREKDVISYNRGQLIGRLFLFVLDYNYHKMKFLIWRSQKNHFKDGDALDETSLEIIVLLANTLGYELALVKKKDYLGDRDHSQVEEENHQWKK